MAEIVTAEALGALLQVVIIDLALAGDNAVVRRAGREGGKSRAQISRHRGVAAYHADRFDNCATGGRSFGLIWRGTPGS